MRYGMSGLAHRWIPVGFPIGTLVVNLLGCLAIGVVLSVVDHRQDVSPAARALLIPGILGGFTTFSSFGHDTFTLLQNSQWVAAGVNVASNVVLGIAAVALGWSLTMAMAH